MATSLVQIGVSASFDAAKYVEGANKKIDRDEKMVDSGDKLGVSIEKNDRRLGAAGGSLGKFIQQNDQAYKATVQFEQGMRRLEAALAAQGNDFLPTYNRQVQLLNERYAANLVVAKQYEERNRSLASSVSGVGTAAKLTFVETEILRAGIINTVQSLAAGESVARTFQTQIFQTAPALSGLTRVLGITTAGIVSIGAPIAAAVVALGTLAAGITRLSNTQDNIRQFGLQLSAVGTNGLTSAADLQKAFEQIRNSGSSATEALAAVKAISSTPLINPARAAEFIRLARDIGTVTGKDLPQATAEFNAALAGGVDGIIKYAFSLGALSAEQAKQIRQSGDLNIAIQAIANQYGGKFQESLTASARASTSLAQAWNKLLDALANFAPVKAVNEFFTRLLDTISALPGKVESLWQKLKETVFGPSAQSQIPSSDPGPGIFGSLSMLESGNRNITQGIVDVNSRQGTPAQGYFQITDPTWRQFASPDILARYPSALSAPRDVQQAVVSSIPLNRFGENTVAGLQRQYGPLDVSRTIGQLAGQAVGGNTVQQQVNDLNKLKEANDQINESLRGTGATAVSVEGYYQALERGRQLGIEGSARSLSELNAARGKGFEASRLESYALEQANQAYRAAGIELKKDTDLARENVSGTIAGVDAFRKSEAAGYRAAAALQATNEIFQKFGNTSEHTADIQTRTNLILEQQAATALISGEQQARVLDRTVAANQKVAAASAQGLAAANDVEIANQAAVSTQDAYAKALATGNDALITRAERLQKETEAQLRSNEAAKQTTQLNLRAEQVKQDVQVIQLEASLQGQTTEQIQAQVTALRVKQDLETRFKDASSEAKQNLINQTDALSQSNILLAEQRSRWERINDEVRSIAETIASAIGGALDRVLSGEKIKSWGKLFSDVLRQIASTIIQAEIVRPLIGSLVQGLGFNQVAQQFGTIGSGGLLTGSAGGGGGFNFGTISQGAGLISNLSGGGGLFGGGFGGIGSAINEFGAANLGTFGGIPFAPGPGLLGTTTLTSLLGSAGAGAGIGGLFASLTGGNTLLGSVGGGIGGLGGSLLAPLLGLGGPVGLIAGGLLGGLGGLFGNNRPSNFASGGNVNIGSGALSSFSSGGVAANDQTAQQILSSVSQFVASIKDLKGIVLPTGTLNVQAGTREGIKTSYAGSLGNINASFSDAQSAIAGLEQAILTNLTATSETLRTILAHISDRGQLQAAVQFAATYDNIVDSTRESVASLSDTAAKLGPFEMAWKQVRESLAAVGEQAHAFGLSLGPVNEALAAASRQLQGSFIDAVNKAFNVASRGDYINQLSDISKSFNASVREAGAIGLGQDQQTYDKLVVIRNSQRNAIFGQLTVAQILDTERAFRGVDDEIANAAHSAADLAIAAANAGTAINDLTDGLKALADLRTSLTTGELSGLTPARMAADMALLALQARDRAAAPGATSADLSAFATASQTALQASTAAYGNAQPTADLRSQVLGSINAILQSRGFASGTFGTPRGWILTGERGPEWFNQAGGGTVLPSGISPPSNEKLMAILEQQSRLLQGIIKQIQAGQVNDDVNMREQTAEISGTRRELTQISTAPDRRKVA